MSSTSSHLTVAPQDLLYASVAYTRDEMHAFDTLLAEHSTGSLLSSPNQITSLVDLPTEILLTIRTHLHRSLTERTRLEAASALAAYEDALLRGLCADCFWWNFDMHGEDVWDWVRNGYKEACQCSGGAPARAPADRYPTGTEASSSKSRSERAASTDIACITPTATSTIPPRGIATKRQWLDAFVERTYGAGNAWTELVPSVLASLSCEINGTVASSPSNEEFASYMRDSTSREFGPAVVIAPLRLGDSDAVVVLGRMTRELGLVEASSTVVFEKTEGAEERKRCTMQYAHELLGRQPRTHQASYFQLHGHISCACASCTLLAAESSSTSTSKQVTLCARNADVLAFFSAVDVSIRHASTLLSFALVSSLLCLTSMLVPRSARAARAEQEA